MQHGRAKHMRNFIQGLIPLSFMILLLSGMMIVNGLFWGGAF